MKVKFENIVWKEGDFFVAQCLNVEVNSFGETKQEAILNLHEALELYFEDALLSEVIKIENPEIISTELEHA